MARPRTELGTYGTITTVGHVTGASGRWVAAPQGTKPTRWRARTKYRDADGVLRDVEVWDTTKAKAVTRLKARLTDRRSPVKARGLRPDTSVADAGSVWLDTIRRTGRLSTNTITQYAGTFERHVKGSDIAGLTLREANRVPVLEGYLHDVADNHGRASAKTARSVVSGILGLAVRHEAIDGNRIRDAHLPSTGKNTDTERDPDRTFSPAELAHLLRFADEHPQAVTYDVADLAWFMAGTGARISEALASRWDDLTLTEPDGAPMTIGEAHIRGTKTDHADRLVPMPDWLTERLRARAAKHGMSGVVFHSPGTVDRDKPRDRRNVTRLLRSLFDAAGYPWATAHTFRSTVGEMVTVSQGATAAANVLGHSRVSMTYDHYADRRKRADGASLALSGLVQA